MVAGACGLWAVVGGCVGGGRWLVGGGVGGCGGHSGFSSLCPEDPGTLSTQITYVESWYKKR